MKSHPLLLWPLVLLLLPAALLGLIENPSSSLLTELPKNEEIQIKEIDQTKPTLLRLTPVAETNRSLRPSQNGRLRSCR